MRSKVSRSINTHLLGRALSRPGMDTRCWVCEAVVEAFHLTDQGAFADITIIPSGEPETVRVGSFYAGPGFGFYAPLEKDDEVLVSFPDADPDQGGVIVARLWSASDAPSATATDNPADVSIHVKEGTSLRIAVTGGGKILMGEAGEATKAVARVTDTVDLGMWAAAALAAVTITPPGGGPPVTLTPAAVAITGKISSGSSKVEASD